MVLGLAFFSELDSRDDFQSQLAKRSRLRGMLALNHASVLALELDCFLNNQREY